LDSQEQLTLLDSKLDSLGIDLAKCVQKEDYSSYYKSLAIFEREHYKDYPDVLYRTDSLWQFLGGTKKDSMAFRRNLALKASYSAKVNDFTNALKYFERAHKFQVLNNGSLYYAWYVENKIANIYSRFNDFDRSIYYQKSILPHIIKENKPARLSRLYSSLGDNYYWKEENRNAEKYYNLQKQLAIKSNDNLALISYYSNQAERALDSKDENAFEYNIKEGTKVCNKLKKNKDDISFLRLQELLRLESDWALIKNDFDAAETKLKSAIDAAGSYYKNPLSREIAKLHDKMAKIYLDNNNLSKCKTSIQHAIKKLIPDHNTSKELTQFHISNENTFTDIFETKAQLYASLFKETRNKLFLDSSLYCIDLALHANKDLEGQLLIRDSKYISAKTNKELISTALNVLRLKQNASTDHSSILKEARKYFDLSKSGILLTNQKKKFITQELSQDLKQTLDSLNLLLSGIIGQYSKNELVDSLEINSTRLQTQIDKIISGVLEKEFTEYEFNDYIEYVETDSFIYILSDINNGFFGVASKKQVTKHLETVLSKIKSRNNDNLLHELSVLTELLIPFPLKKLNHLEIIPDGKLHLLPFEILRVDNKYLFESYSVSHQLHHKTYKQSNTKIKNNAAFCLVPVYDEDPEITQLVNRGNLGPLPFAKKEASAIKEILGLVDIKNNINPMDLGTLLKEKNIFHYSGHGYADSEHMYLAIKDMNNEITHVNEQQIQFMQNDLELVCLSACETGIGEYESGEGIRSVANSFLNSGARTIVQSLWKVNDQSTSQLISRFYKNLKKGDDKPVALQKAKIWFLEHATAENSHPYYWAGFTLTGSKEAIFKKTTNWKLWIIYILGIMAFLYIIKTSKDQLK